MSNSNITLPFNDSKDTASSNIWVRLEQEKIPDYSNALNFSDMYQMWVMAKYGTSAFMYLQNYCPISINADGTVTVAISFYSYPSQMDLVYSVDTSLGELGEKIRISEDREFDLKFENSNNATLPYVATNLEITPISRAIHSSKGEIPFPSYTVDGSVITLSESCFAVVRVKCKAQGFLHTVLLTFVKEETTKDENGDINKTGYKISNIQCTETAKWINGEYEQQEDVLDLEIPPCVESYLAQCGEGTGGGLKVIPLDKDRHQVVYWNVCTGNILAVFVEGGE
jgi:hypothetical protein